MTRDELLARRWGAVLSPETTPERVVARLGAVQAQDFNMGLMAVGIRSGATAAAVEGSLDKGTLARLHIMRPTWHLVAAEDLRWLMDLTADRVASAAVTGYKQTGLTPEIRAEARRVIERALRDGPRTRDEVMEALAEAGFDVAGLRSVHYMMDAELSLLVCNGPRRGKTITYDLVDRRIPTSGPVPRYEALARLALRYICGHGPATERDLSWWSGLTLTEVRAGLQANRPALTTANYEDSELWFDPEGPVADLKGFGWLPAYDEGLVAFADRSATLDPAFKNTVMTGNGIFNPVVIHHGRVVGTWKRQEKAKSVTVEVAWFAKEPKGGEKARKEFEGWLAGFLGKASSTIGTRGDAPTPSRRGRS